MSKDYYIGQKNPLHAGTPHDPHGSIVERKRWTLQEIQNMSAEEYRINLSNPDFVAAIDGFNAKMPTPENEGRNA